VAKNSLGQIQEITVLIKTQGSDTKLVAQMQPLSEAQGLSRKIIAANPSPRLFAKLVTVKTAV